jgi:hypothetical protein
MPSLNGHLVTVQGLRMTMPTSCCRCGAPSTRQLKTSTAVRGFGSNKTRSIEVPYCTACAARAKKIQSARTLLYLQAIGVALAASGFGFLAAFLPRVVLVGVPVALASLAAVVLRQRVGDGVDDPWGAFLSKGTNKDSTFFCTHTEWAQQFAQANGVSAIAGTYRDSVRPWIGALVVALGAAAFVAFAVRPEVYIDNGGAQPAQIWIDGKPSIVAQSTLNKGQTRATIEVPIGTHVFGWSPVGAKAPVGQTKPRKVEWMGDHLYNPNSTACYWLDVSVYGSASSKGMQQGPQPVDEFYTFSSINNWFKDNPTSISTKSSGETRTAINTIKYCQELTAQGCPVEVRSAFAGCIAKAVAADSKPAIETCVSEAAKTCAGKSSK